MFKPHYGHCTICQDTDKRFIVVAHPPMCDRCNRLKKAKAVLKVSAMKRGKKPTGEKQVFLEIWSEREHQCVHCQVWLGEEPLAQYFAHKIRKGKDKALRLDKNNIQLMCLDCHMAMDQGTIEQFEKRRKI